MVEAQECMRGGSHHLDKMETLVGAPQRRRCVGYGGGVEMDERIGMGWKEEGRRTRRGSRQNLVGECETAGGAFEKKKGSSKRRKEEMGRNRETLPPMGGERMREHTTLEIRRDGLAVVNWLSGTSR